MKKLIKKLIYMYVNWERMRPNLFYLDTLKLKPGDKVAYNWRYRYYLFVDSERLGPPSVKRKEILKQAYEVIEVDIFVTGLVKLKGLGWINSYWLKKVKG